MWQLNSIIQEWQKKVEIFVFEYGIQNYNGDKLNQMNGLGSDYEKP